MQLHSSARYLYTMDTTPILITLAVKEPGKGTVSKAYSLEDAVFIHDAVMMHFILKTRGNLVRNARLVVIYLLDRRVHIALSNSFGRVGGSSNGFRVSRI
jgi:hypothetical protein